MKVEVGAISKPTTGITGTLPSLLKRSWVKIAAVMFLLLVLEFQLLYSVEHESLTFDEGDHIFAGYMSLKHHDFGLNPEHPPLVKMIAAVPLLRMNLHEPQLQNRYFKTEAYLSGRDLIFQNDHETIIFRARMAASIFALLVALLAFLTAQEMFGSGAGFIALVGTRRSVGFRGRPLLYRQAFRSAAAGDAGLARSQRVVAPPSSGGRDP